MDGESKDAISRVLVNRLFSNPRLMKRTLARYELALEFEKKFGTYQGSEQSSDRWLALWIAATQRWPRMRDLLQQHDESYWRAMEKAWRGANPELHPGPMARKLLAEPAALDWLISNQILQSQENRESLRQTDERLRQLGL